MIYLDHNATTPLAPQVLAAMLDALKAGAANPSSLHFPGQRARGLLDSARESIAKSLKCSPKELVFTSGGSEANNLALQGCFRGRRAFEQRVVVGATEHPSVLQTALMLKKEGAEVVEIEVDSNGLPKLDVLEGVLKEGAALASFMWVNNETGTLLPVEQISRLCRSLGVPLHVDAVQAAGKVPIDLSQHPIDLLSLSAHKISGPRGSGLLFVREGTPITPLQFGGSQEQGLRPGTENLAGAVGLAHALQLATESLNSEHQRQLQLRERLENGVLELWPQAVVVSQGVERVANTSSICFPGLRSEALLMALDVAGVCASAGSACSSGTVGSSHVLQAQGISKELAQGVVRFSLGTSSSQADVEGCLERLATVLERLSRHERHD